jgi:hypothetical protein
LLPLCRLHQRPVPTRCHITFYQTLKPPSQTTLSGANPLYSGLDRRAKGNSLLLTVMSIFVLPWLTFTFCIIAHSFPSRFNRIATDIDSLDSGLAYAVRLGIGRRGLRKTWGNRRNFFGCSPFQWRISSHCIFENHHSLAHYRWSFWHRWPIPAVFIP